eukprot:gene13564-18203_t
MQENSSNFDSINNESNNDRKVESVRKQKIQWDEQTIAEHDKERGSRQKIDEAPTPYRYLSESDQSECESGSDGESLVKHQFHTNNLSLSFNNMHNHNNIDNSNSLSPHAVMSQLGQSTREQASNMITDSWETINAKLQYEKHLQDLNINYNNNINASANGSTSDNNYDNYNYSSNDAADEMVMSENSRRGGMNITMGMGTNENMMIGEILSAKPASITSTGSGSDVFVRALLEEGDDNPSGLTSNNRNNSNNDRSSSTIPVPMAVEDVNHGDDENEGSSSNYSHKNKDENTSQFRSKRAHHYNEFKVLQAMRAKLADQEDEDDDV